MKALGFCSLELQLLPFLNLPTHFFIVFLLHL